MVKNPPANAADVSLILGSGRSPEEGNGNPLQYYCLGNPKDRGAWWATVHGVARNQTTEPPHTHTHTHTHTETEEVASMVKYINVPPWTLQRTVRYSRI